MSLNIRQWLTERNINLSEQSTDAKLAGIAFRLLQDMELKSLTVFDICLVAEILELPVLSAYQLANTLSPLTVWLLRVMSRRKPLKRAEGTWLSFQIAYINAFQHILTQELHFKRPWLYRSGFEPEILLRESELKLDLDLNLYSFPFNDTKLPTVLKTLRPGRLSDTQAEQALTMLADSLLGQQFNQVLFAWFVANGAEEMEAKLIIQRLGYGLSGFLIPVVANNPLALAQLQKFVRLCNLTAVNEQFVSDDFNQDYSLNLERENYRSQLIKHLSEPLFMEYFTVKDIYVTLQGELLRKPPPKTLHNFLDQPTNAIPEDDQFVDLMSYVISQLDDSSTITVISGSMGRGKTTFCQMLSAQVAMEIYPRWLPIFISCHDITLGDSLEQSLSSAFPLGKFATSDSWLSVDHPPCLLILDGLDQLPYSSSSQRYITKFIDQLIQFQTRKDLGKKTKIIVTMRDHTPLGLCKAPYSLLPTVVKELKLWDEIAIKPLDKEEFRYWFQQWTKVQSKSIAQAYFSFLKQSGIFRKKQENPDINSLISKPLILYIVGILYRDGFIDENILKQQNPQLEYTIYYLLCRWILGEPSPHLGLRTDLVTEGLAHASRSREGISNFLGGLSSQLLLANIQDYALKILHNCQVNLDDLPQIKYLGNIFFNTHDPQKIKFSQQQMGEYLAAEAIASKLQFITQKQKNHYGESIFVINSSLKLAEEIYQLLSYDVFSSHIKELIMEILKKESSKNSNDFQLETLFHRLNEFYQNYCYGRWLDRGILQQISQHKCKNNSIYNSLQIDAIVGLNVFLLLCKISQTTEIPFFPCGHPHISSNFDPNRLLIFLSRLTPLDPNAFWWRLCQGRSEQLVNDSLSKLQLPFACLNHLMLTEVNLWKSNLSSAELIGINLSRANLQEANLSKANLSNANLTNVNLSAANLEGANLTGANLTGVNLTLTNLKNACLDQAIMDENTRNIAQGKGAFFSQEEFKTYSEYLVTKNTDLVGENFYLDSHEESLLIETAEGKPLMLKNINLEEQNISTRFNYQSNAEIISDQEDDQATQTIALENYWHSSVISDH
jgi:uncharacterized protein YjbI with pentapeptide repeats